MRGRRLSLMSAGVAVVTFASFAATIAGGGALPAAAAATVPNVAAPAASAETRQPIDPGNSVLPSPSVPVDPALTQLVLNGGTPAGGFTVGTPAYVASGLTPPKGGAASTSSQAAASKGSGIAPLAVTTGATTFVAPGVYLVPSQATTSPSARREAAGALDTANNVDVLFGGRGTSTYDNDTWTFDGTNWVHKTPASPPSVRMGASMAYDASTGTTILFGGYDGTTYMSDTWAWNGSTWTHLSPATSPSGRRLASMAYSPTLGKLVLFGGVGSSGELADTWTYNGTTWTNVTGTPSPSVRANAGFAYDPSASDLLLYGGESGGGTTVLGDTWTYTASGWTAQSPTHFPGNRNGMGFAYDSVLGHVVLAAGNDGTSDYQDFWLWDGTDWEQGRQPDFGGPRHDLLMVPSAANGQLLAFGGISGSTVFGDTGVIDWGQLGVPKNATFTTHPVDDRSTYGVNVYNGNLVVSANDMSVAGVGLGFSVQREFSNEGGYLGTVGVSWELTNSFDTWWSALPDGSIVVSGVRGQADMLYFKKSGATFSSPAGINAALATSGTGYTLTFNASSEVLTFNSAGELTSDADRNGHTITFGWTSGAPSSITDTQGRSYTVTLTGGLITKITDPTTRFVQFATTSSYLTQVTDGAGDVTNYSYAICGCGYLTGIQDPNGKTTVPGFALGTSRVDSIDDPQTSPHTTTFTYAAPDSGVSAWGKTTVTDQNSHATVYQAQYAGQVVQVTDARSNSRKATFNANDDIMTAVDAIGTGNVTSYGYDALNNPTSAALPTGASTTAQYASGGGCSTTDSIHPYLVKCVNDAQGNQNTFTYDGPGNTLTNKNVTTGATLTYTYNPSTPTCGGKVGQLCSSQDGNLHTTSYSYDSNGNLTTITPPSPLGATTQTFDSLGRVATVTDGKSQKTTYSYDGDDRITQVLTNGATTCTYTAGTCVGYGFDDNGNRTSMHDKTGLTQYAFDVMNRETVKTLPSTATLTLGYDHAGNITTYADAGGTVTYGYNAANQLTSLAEPGGSCSGTISLCTTFVVNNNGQRTSTTYPGSTVMTVTPDNSGRPTEIKTVHSGTSIADFSYSYLNGATDTELTQTRTDHVTGLVTTYSYDAKDELSKAVEKNGGTTTASWLYCYDAAGNRTSFSSTAGAGCPGATTTYTYNAANELTAVNGVSTGWSYDLDGNETAGASSVARTAETYSASNQLTSITTGSATAMAYAGLTNDERVTAGSTTYQNGQEGLASQTVSSTTTNWTRDPSGTLISERTGGSHYYYVFDGLGSVVALVNSSGTAVNTYSYDPYGNTRASTGTTLNPFNYTSGYKDATGVYHLGARYYDTNLGRFTQQDPSGQEANTYAYGADNPGNDVDPTGLLFVSLGIQLNLGPVHLGVGVDAGSGGLQPFAQASVGVAEESLFSPIATINGGSSSTGGAVNLSACTLGVCVDNTGATSLDLTGSSGLFGTATYTF